MEFIVLPLAENSLNGPNAPAALNQIFAIVNVGAGVSLTAQGDFQFVEAKLFADGDARHTWLFDSLGNGQFTIRAGVFPSGPIPAAGGIPFPVLSQGSVPDDGVPSVITKSGVVDNRDRWRIIPDHDGRYRFQNVDSGQNLTIARNADNPNFRVSAHLGDNTVTIDKGDLWQVSLLKREPFFTPGVLIQTVSNQFIALGPGTWDADQLAALNPPLTGPAIQQITIQPGVALSVFPEPHLKGDPDKIRVTGPFVPQGFFANARFGSVLVEPVVQFFRLPDFTDGPVPFEFILSGEGLNSLVDPQSGLIPIRSIRVPRGMIVTLFAEENCKGEAKTITDNLAFIDFEAKSVLVATIGTRIPTKPCASAIPSLLNFMSAAFPPLPS